MSLLLNLSVPIKYNSNFLCLSLSVGFTKSKEEIMQSLSASLIEVNPTLEHYEHLRKVVIMKEEWTINNGLMTPTLKVKRNDVEKIHLPKYPIWYAQSTTVVWE